MKPLRLSSRLLPVAAYLLLHLHSGCAGSSASQHGSSTLAVPDRVGDANYSAALRLFHRMPEMDADKRRLRKQLFAHLARRNRSVLQSASYSKVEAHFSDYAALLRPEDYERKQIPAGMVPIAKNLMRMASKRGDESRALAALAVLRVLPGNAGVPYKKKYQLLSKWGREARRGRFESPGGYRELVEVWDEHAQLTPAPDVLARLVALLEQSRALFLQYLSQNKKLVANPAMLAALRQRVSQLGSLDYDLAGVYLRVGDIRKAVAVVEKSQESERDRSQLAGVLRDALTPPARADAIAALVQAYLERQNMDVAEALCRVGTQREPSDARFPLCLARMSAVAQDYEGAVAWYREAVHLAPKTRRIYDEALGVLGHLMERRVFEKDPRSTRRLAQSAQFILHARKERWPNEKSPVGAESLYLIIGRAEANAGNIDKAREAFKRSLKQRENAEALMQLGFLEERVGRHDKAQKLYLRALPLATREPEKSGARAEILERLGDTFRRSGNTSQAQAYYRRAVRIWKTQPEVEDKRLQATMQLRQAVLLDRLGESEEAAKLFEEAVNAAPDWREGYAQALSHLVTSDKVHEDLALKLLRASQRQLTLDPEWKVYFALWVQIILKRSEGNRSNNEVEVLLQEASGMKPWWSKLAGFGIGKLDYAALRSHAKGRGEQTEALFYHGAHLLGKGEADQAKQQFKRVRDLGMVGFYEYVMAQELTDNLQKPERKK